MKGLFNLSTFNAGLPTGTLQEIGTAHDATLAYVDLSLGYWMYQNFNCGATISGLAPMFEVHYTGSMTNTDIIRTNRGGATYQIGSGDDLDLVNVVFGLTTVIKDSSTLTVGYTTPVAGSDQQFDGELRAMLNVFFGGSRANAAYGNRRFVSF